jgi:hypothetical protein
LNSYQNFALRKSRKLLNSRPYIVLANDNLRLLSVTVGY